MLSWLHVMTSVTSHIAYIIELWGGELNLHGSMGVYGNMYYVCVCVLYATTYVCMYVHTYIHTYIHTGTFSGGVAVPV